MGASMVTATKAQELTVNSNFLFFSPRSHTLQTRRVVAAAITTKGNNKLKAIS